MYLGCMYKLNQSYSPTLALILNKNTIGMSYDIYTNNVTSANIRMSAFEFTFARKLDFSRMKYADNKAGRMRTLFD